MRDSRTHVYLSTFAMSSGFYIFMGILARIKKPIANQFELSQSFLGVLDGSLFLGSLLGNIFITIFKITKPIKSAILVCFISIFSLEIQILGFLWPSLAKPILLISRFIYGFTMIQLILIIAILFHHFNSSQDHGKTEIWYAITSLGDPLGLLLTQILIDYLNLDWKLAMSLIMVIPIFSSVYFYKSVSQITSSSQQNQERISMSKTLTILKNFYRKKSNISHTVTYAMLGTQYYMILLWLPYFFIHIGYGGSATLISMITPISIPVGTIMFQLSLLITCKRQLISFYIYSRCLQGIKVATNMRSDLTYAISSISSTAISVALSYLGSDPRQLIIYLILILISSLLFSNYYCYIGTTDLKIRTQNREELIMISSVNKITRSLLQITIMLLIGFWMETDIHSLFKMAAILTGVCNILLLIRCCKQPQSFNYYDNKQIEISQREE